MDPRPYHFEYRRPRYANPTYQSSHLYDSISSFNVQPPRNPENLNNSFSANELPLKRANSTDLAPKKLVELQGIGDYRFPAHSNIQTTKKSGSSMLASYGNTLMKNTWMEQQEIYVGQEKEFNIISFYPRSVKPKLKQFPRLTLEDRLLERTTPTDFK